MLKLKFKKWRIFWVGAIVGILVFVAITGVVGCSSTTADSLKEESEMLSDEPEPKEEANIETATEEKLVKIQAGTYLINEDIEPGRYKSEGDIQYWERLSGLSGELDDIIANESMISGSTIVDIKESDVAFSFSGTGYFFLVDENYEGEKKTSFGDGCYIVGVDIEPGRYRSETGADYWARLKGFSGELDDIITNDAMVEGTVIVEIKESDVGFQTRGAEWEKID